MGPFRKYVTGIMTFFIQFNFVTLCQFYCTTSPVSFTKLHQETIELEGKRFLHIWLLQHITLYQRCQKITSLNTIEFLDTFAFIINSLWQSGEISIFLCKYYIAVSERSVGSFLNVLFLSLTVILSELHEKKRKKDWVREKST